MCRKTDDIENEVKNRRFKNMNDITTNNPDKTKYIMPAEYDIHSGTLMVWPVRPGSWGKDSQFHHILRIV